MHRLEDYIDIVGKGVIASIYQKASKLYGKHILHINSTNQGGGVAEMLQSLVPLMNDAGIDAGWRILHGNPDFFSITKEFHNGLQGQPIELTPAKIEEYLDTNRNFSIYTHVGHDCVFIHDPQPLPLINYFKKRQPWIWRCHIDLSHPDEPLWDFLSKQVLKYDKIIISNLKYKKQNCPIEQRVIFPAIDPLSLKNREATRQEITDTLAKFDIPADKPIITQVSRFDKWKDPQGVVDVFAMVKEKIDCRLVLCGSMASDDPEGIVIYESIKEKSKPFLKNRDIILLTVENNMLVNVLQRVSSVIIQKSLREGFGLTVTEGLWKGKPVLASNVGGIPLQIVDGENGFLLDAHDNKGFADRIIQILEDPKLSKHVSQRARESVRSNFLITRLLSDYLELLNDVFR
ncbi:MAG: glycosyltransferase [Candidatus Auribacterota bacterium]|jgi:trehalose synthase|nr:glycosyltransferase [Candidatus Auribacterota bacterium]